MTTWGTITVGRISLRETTVASENSGSDGAGRGLSLSGQESMPPLTRTQLVVRHDDLLALEQGSLVPVTFTDKPERNGYYTVSSSSADLDDRQGEVVTSTWKLDLTRVGTENEVDLQSRLSGTVRANDFSLTGERWHAPPAGHYGYVTGNTQPSTMTRASEDGAMTVYRGVPAGVSPRWGCTPANYGLARVRVMSDGAERTGVDVAVDGGSFELSNALVRVRPLASGGSLEVAAYDGTQWEPKNWTLTIGASAISGWDAASVLRNDYEAAVLRLTKARAPGRTVLDLTLRRGSRILEGYLQTDVSATLSVALSVSETTSSFAASGYVVATADDAAGNRYTAGSAKAFTVPASGGVSKTSTTAVDFYLGAVVGGGSAVSGDAAVDLRNQYIGTLPERVYGVRR